MKSVRNQKIEEFMLQQICYRSDDGTVLLVSIGTVGDSSCGRSNAPAKTDCKESFMALHVDGSICGIEISYNLDSTFLFHGHLPVRSHTIREVLNKLSATPNTIEQVSAAQPIFQHQVGSALGWVMPIKDWVSKNKERNAEIEKIVSEYSRLPIPGQKALVEKILRSAGRTLTCSNPTPAVVDEPVPRNPETSPETSKINSYYRKSQPISWVQKLITGICLTSVGAAAGFAALVSLQSLAAVWQAAVHVIGLAATAIPVMAAGILSMVAFHKIDKSILKWSGNKVGLLPVDRSDPRNCDMYVHRSDRWAYAKIGCVMIVGAAGTIGFMRWENGRIYNAAQKYLLPAESSTPQPAKPEKQNDFQPKILLPKNRALYQARYERCL
ncbi:MAG: hypothetical protein EYC62_04075 [Alphaproteobacteria bacterium]|nr:MAG: hypothetical protein EYC62_04075 [Alphaproteobacteria bacterium]